VVPQHTVFPIPKNLNFVSAACLGVAGLTAAMSLWRWLGVPMVSESATQPGRRDAILIWGGSTVTGQFAIQLAAQAGLEVIAVCSTSTAALVSSLGARHVVTYNDKTEFHIIGEILYLAQGRLTKAIDLVGAKTAKLVLQVIAACSRDKPVDFAPLAFMSSKGVIPDNARVQNVEMKQFVLNSASGAYGAHLNMLVETGCLRLPTIRVLEGGLGAVERGLEILKGGKLAGEKLVVSFP
jgi:NADPH:quinone reductase-like Zn-dependent oxidoreductase